MRNKQVEIQYSKLNVSVELLLECIRRETAINDRILVSIEAYRCNRSRLALSRVSFVMVYQKLTANVAISPQVLTGEGSHAVRHLARKRWQTHNAKANPDAAVTTRFCAIQTRWRCSNLKRSLPLLD